MAEEWEMMFASQNDVAKGKGGESGKPYKWEFGGKTFRGFYDIMLSWEVDVRLPKANDVCCANDAYLR